jgi:WD40 repeat protein
LRDHRDWVQAITLSHDEALLLSGDDSGLVILRERVSGKPLRQWTTRGWVYALAIAPNKQQAFVSERIPLVFDSGRYDAAKIWDLNSGQPLLDLSKEYKGMYLAAAVYSPDGKWLAVGRGGEVDGPNGKVFVIDATSGKRLRECSPGHLYGITDMVLYPDGEHLLTSGRDTLIRVWHVPSGKLIRELGQPRGGQFKDWIHAIALSPDGKWLAAADMIGAVQVWKLVE